MNLKVLTSPETVKANSNENKCGCIYFLRKFSITICFAFQLGSFRFHCSRLVLKFRSCFFIGNFKSDTQNRQSSTKMRATSLYCRNKTMFKLHKFLLKPDNKKLMTLFECNHSDSAASFDRRWRPKEVQRNHSSSLVAPRAPCHRQNQSLALIWWCLFSR